MRFVRAYWVGDVDEADCARLAGGGSAAQDANSTTSSPASTCRSASAPDRVVPSTRRRQSAAARGSRWCARAVAGATGRSKRRCLSYLGARGQDTAAALRELVDLAESLPGQFKPEFELGYWAGVSEGAERWYVRFEGDIRDNEFTVLGSLSRGDFATRGARSEGTRLLTELVRRAE